MLTAISACLTKEACLGKGNIINPTKLGEPYLTKAGNSGLGASPPAWRCPRRLPAAGTSCSGARPNAGTQRDGRHFGARLAAVTRPEEHPRQLRRTALPRIGPASTSARFDLYPKPSEESSKRHWFAESEAPSPTAGPRRGAIGAAGKAASAPHRPSGQRRAGAGVRHAQTINQAQPMSAGACVRKAGEDRKKPRKN